jgi:urease accessory protein UreF
MVFLAQVDPEKAAAGLGRDFLPWALVIVLAALAVLFKLAWDQWTKRDAEKTEQIKQLTADNAALQKELRDTTKANGEEQRKLMFEIVPLTGKVVDALEYLEARKLEVRKKEP